MGLTYFLSTFMTEAEKKHIADKQKSAWWLMQKANQNAPFGDPIQKCNLVPISNQINIKKSPSGNMSYGGLKTCRNSWACPICSPRRMAEKSELVRGMNWLIPWKPVMITYTIQHSRGESLSHLMDQLTLALRMARIGKRRAAYKKICHGYIRSAEVTYSDINGWHPHYHEINYLREGATLQQLEDTVIGDYKKALSKAGKLVNDITVQAMEWEGETDYLTKGADISAELMGGLEKRYDESTNVFGLLSLARNRDNANRYTNLYQEYLKATYRRKVTVISRSLSEYQKKVQRKIDQSNEFDPNEHEVIATLTKKEWRDICRKGIRYEVLATLEG